MKAIFNHFLALIFAVLMTLGMFAPDSIVIDGVPEKAENTTRVISFNLRCNDDIYGTIKNRSKFITEAIKAYMPDSFGVQEANRKWLDAFDKTLSDLYARVGEPRDNTRNSEYSCVYYLKDKFELIDSGTIWLSKTPDVFGSKSFSSSLPRICTWATLKNKETGAVYTHANTHLDHLLESTRVKQAKVLVEKIKELSEVSAKVVCTGDFNTEEGAKAYKVVAGELNDSKFVAKTSDSGATFHDYGRPLTGKKKPIDFIFVTKGVEVETYKIIDNTVNYMYLSDHYGLCADIYI